MLAAMPAAAQDDEWDEWDDDEDTEEDVTIFYDTRIINGHSVETLEKGALDFRIVHRFGDIAVNESHRTLFGLDNSTDIRIAFEYGITDDLSIGFGRSKGAGPLAQLWDGYAKYKFFNQNAKFPVSLSLSLSGFYTSMQADNSPVSATSFKETAHRFSYYSQLIVARNFGDRVMVQLAPGYLHRNYVAFEDQNSLVTVGAVAKIRVFPKVSFVTEYTYVLRDESNILDIDYYNPLGFGVEFKTFAHVFQLSFMNSPGIGEAQYIPYTGKNWGDGEFRFGFTIARQF